MKGIIGKKVGMTSFFDEGGKNIPCTLLEAGPCVITQIKTNETDGYNAVQLGYGLKKEKNTAKPQIKHFAKAGTTPKRKVMEIRDFDIEKSLGDTVTVEIFAEGDKVSIVGTSKGKGFQGVVKRHGFHGVGSNSHGQHDRNRAPGSLGGSSYPARVFKGLRMAGRDGGKNIKVRNVSVMRIFAEKNLLVVNGCVPGPKGSYVMIQNQN
ncbi:MAG: 50S ribosomal protein L3 [Chitinophagales bacterium]|jgi:large subunit ribosomal protein L3|nr:50S ribosomal protein L3 [Chitinophagales bacterium]